MKKIMILFLFLMLFTLSSCKKCKETPSVVDPRKSAAEIKQAYKYFDITIDYNGVVYRIVKGSGGTLYEDTKAGDRVYYDSEKNVSYLIFDNVKYEEEMNYDFSTKINVIYDLLTLHLNSKNFSKLLKEKITYLDRSVTKYHRDSSDLAEETYYIDDETGACLYACLDSGSSRVLCKVNQLKLGDQSLDTFKSYESFQKIDLSVIKDKTTILSHFQQYNISFKIDDSTYQMISTTDGLLIKTNNSANLYITSLDKWYIVDFSSKTKQELNLSHTKEDVENTLLNQLTSHLDKIDKQFYVTENGQYMNRPIRTYIKVNRTTGGVYYQKYDVDIETGACFNKKIGSSVFSIIDYQTEASLEEFFTYPTTSYVSWPSEHPYLEGIEEIKYATFDKAIVFDDELFVYYNNVGNNDYLNMIDFFIENGFDQLEEQSEASDYKKYVTKRNDGLIVSLEYVVSKRNLTIVFKK